MKTTVFGIIVGGTIATLGYFSWQGDVTNAYLFVVGLALIGLNLAGGLRKKRTIETRA
ncbi:MAG: hypothetical protein RI942_1065 [Pseudomonadota bacterium]|jgi:hypothetical protein